MTQLPLDQLAADIRARLDTADQNIKKAKDKAKEMRLSAAIQIAEAKRRVGEGEAGDGVTWDEWRKTNLKRSASYVNKMLVIGNSSAPEAALEDYHEKDRLRKQTSGSETSEFRASPFDPVTSLVRSEWLAGMITAWGRGTPEDQAEFRRHIG